jgi:hypothetical protein
VETLLAIEALESDERWLFLSNTPLHTSLGEMVSAASRRHLIEEAFNPCAAWLFDRARWLGLHGTSA